MLRKPNGIPSPTSTDMRSDGPCPDILLKRCRPGNTTLASVVRDGHVECCGGQVALKPHVHYKGATANVRA